MRNRLGFRVAGYSHREHSVFERSYFIYRSVHLWAVVGVGCLQSLRRVGRFGL